MWYTVRSCGVGYNVIKFDEDFNQLHQYFIFKTRVLGEWHCGCFQRKRPNCRHRVMVDKFLIRKRVDTGWFYNYEVDGWKELVKGENDEY